MEGARFDFLGSSLFGEWSKNELSHGDGVNVDRLEGDVKKTMPARLKVPQDWLSFYVLRKGTAMIWGEADKRWFVIPPQSVTYIRGPVNFLVNFARGEHLLELVHWPSRAAPFLSEWLERQRLKGSKVDRPRIFATMPYNPNFITALDRFDSAVAGNPEVMQPLVYSVLYEILPRLVRSRTKLGLTPVPPDIPPNISGLIQQVRQSPDSPWPLKEAADIVGYSPFHFSRVYKQLVGYGFHEFVDRCRTEHAVDMLCTSDSPIDVVAAASGFGTTQALRESVKEYLGLVPSELRTNPDEVSGRS